MKRVVDSLPIQSSCEEFQLNESKCKELRIILAQNKLEFWLNNDKQQAFSDIELR